MTTTARTRSSVPRWRRILAAVLIVVGCVLAPLSVMAVWIHGTLLDTDQYVDTVGPLVDEPAVQEAIANRVATALIASSDLETQVAASLPDRASFVAPFVVDGAERVVHRAALRLAESDRFETLWEKANRSAHTQVVAVLKGDSSDRVSTKNGQVVVELGPIIDRVKQRLDERGISAFDNADGQRVNRQIVLIESSDLDSAQGAVKLLDKLAIVLPILMLIVLGIGIALSWNRRRSLLRVALGVAFAMVVLLTLFNVVRSLYLDALPATVSQPAAAAVYDQLLSFLTTSLRTVFVVAVVIATGAWIAGPANIATGIRTGVRDAIRGNNGPTTSPSPISTFIDRFGTLLRVLVVSVGLVLLVVLDHPGPVAVLVITVLVLVALLLIEFLGRSTPKPALDEP